MSSDFLGSLQRCRISAWALSLILAALFVATQIQASLWNGRLSLPPTYDDVGYFNDAVTRLRLLFDRGMRAFIADYAARPPHSPSHTLLAMMGFSVFGVRDWAAVAATAIPIALLIRLFFALTHGLSLLLSGLLVASILLMPFAGFLVVEFRPDALCGLFLASGALVTVLLPWRKDGTLQVVAGLLFAGALLTKPSVFPLTLVVIGSAISLATLPAMRDLSMWRGAILPAIVTSIVALAVSGPHYVFALPSIVRYIYRHAVSESASLWGTPLPIKERLAYYLTGPGAEAPIGWWLFVGVGATFAAFALALIQRQWLTVYRIAAAIVTAGAAYAILTYVNNRSPWIGLEFTTFIPLGIVAAIAWLCGPTMPQDVRRAGCLIAAALFLVSAATFTFPGPRLGQPVPRNISAAYQGAVNRVADVLATRPALNSKIVYMGAIGQYVNLNTLNFALAARDVPAPHLVSLYVSGNIEEHKTALAKANIAILFSASSDEPLRWLPSYGLVGPLLLAVKQAGFQEIARLPDTNRKGDIVIYER